MPLFISSFRRADELQWLWNLDAIEVGKGRTRMKELQFHQEI